ncbi:alpha/beta fold hydrolase [Rhodoferax aquaticus]|uniref:Alpha/beta hydrolase n=1 Tax=Rhodoferax aquaticus TaxID=2527691 RepID=A0A515ESI4_9BURK|nr:alpha/beta hydrolase [Rhodoferax aquaticus]QDL55588.1 alpha/beta hydrolase [Rhodoferax aquaticus]
MRNPLQWFATVAVALVAGCSNPPYPRGAMESLYPDGKYPALSTVQVQGRYVGMAKTTTAPVEAAQAPVLLFIHGSPGDWKAWAHFLKASELPTFDTRIAVDRPGFGASGAGQVVPDLRAQAALLATLIPKGRKAIVIGHSLGGPIAAWMAVDAPDQVCAAISLAGSLSSKYEAPRWYNYLADFALVRWAIPQEMVWSNQEMMPLSSELEKLEHALPTLHVPLLLLQGGKDTLVDPRTVDEVQAFAPAQWLSIQRLPDATHFFLWEDPDAVINAIRKLPCA